MNTFGRNIRFTDFGEAHGVAVGGVLDGLPSQFVIDTDAIQAALKQRAGINSDGTYCTGVSERATNETDRVEWLSGVIMADDQLVTLGTPIAFIVRNTDVRPEDYEVLKNVYREGHADRVYERKYGIRDYRGGGRASARETVARVVAGCIVQQWLAPRGITIRARLIQVGNETDSSRFDSLLEQTQQAGDSIGGIIECRIQGVPAGIGEPIFDKLQARLAYAVMSINGCKGFEYGSGFASVSMHGSDGFQNGGIVGGISDGDEIVSRCVFKPTATIAQLYSGRHDTCIAVRAVPVVEAMTALAISDLAIDNLRFDNH